MLSISQRTLFLAQRLIAYDIIGSRDYSSTFPYAPFEDCVLLNLYENPYRVVDQLAEHALSNVSLT